jgi:hypothetical protein
MVTDWLKKKCNRKVTIRTDGEPLIVAIVERVKAARTEETTLQRSPTRSSQSLGAAERAVRTVKQQFKTLRFQLEAKYGLPLLPSSPIWTWIGRHVAWLYDRYHVMASGKTPFEIYNDHYYKGELCIFSETVFMKEAVSKTGQGRQNPRVKGADTAWRKGIWVGRTTDTNEHIVSQIQAQECVVPFVV